MKQNELLREIEQRVTQEMLEKGFYPPTLFISGSQSRLGHTFTSFSGSLDEQKGAMQTLGSEIAKGHPELGLLEHVFFVIIIHLSSKHDTETQTVPYPKVALIIHGTDIATNNHCAKVFELVQDSGGVVREINERPSKGEVPENPWLAAFVRGFQERTVER